jgi:hypothetical protein
MPEIVKAEPEIKEFLVDAKYRDQVTLVDMDGRGSWPFLAVRALARSSWWGRRQGKG